MTGVKITNKLSQNRKRKITVILLAVLLAAAIVASAGLWLVFRSRSLDLSVPYDGAAEFYNDAFGAEAFQKAAAFASDLCVGSADISREGVSISQQACAGLFDLESGTVLFAQGMYDRMYPASITKIMTGILAVKYGNMDDVVTITDAELNLEEGSTEVGFQPGDQVTMGELLHVLLIYSGNDAAMAIARQVGGTVDQFVEMMNQEAAALGATGTHFVNPSGLHDENHYTTVYDIYLMLNEALNYPEFTEVMQLSSYNLTFTRNGEEQVIHMDSTDQYMTRQVPTPKDVTILGGKTGTTGDAGSCLALVSQNAYGEPFISIVLHAPTKASLYDNMSQLLSQINS